MPLASALPFSLESWVQPCLKTNENNFVNMIFILYVILKIDFEYKNRNNAIFYICISSGRKLTPLAEANGTFRTS